MSDKELKKINEGDTPASRWNEEGKEDPHGTRYDCSRKELAKGDFTDDEIANHLMYHFRDVNGISYVQAAQDRIRWLSRRLVKANDMNHELLTANYGPGINTSNKFLNPILGADYYEAVAALEKNTKVEYGMSAMEVFNAVKDNFKELPPMDAMLLSDTDVVSILSNAGNVLHNLGCNHSNEDEGDEYSDYGHELWGVAQAIGDCLNDHPDIRLKINQAIANKNLRTQRQMEKVYKRKESIQPSDDSDIVEGNGDILRNSPL